MIAPVSAAVIIPGIIERPEGTRHYLMAQAGAPGQGKRPLVIVLHGHGSSAATTFGRDRINDPAAFWLDIAEREQLLVIAPDGWKGSDNKQGWNDCRADAPTNPATDDVGFLQALIDKAVAEYGADPQRVYITGGSNGGGMTYRAAIELRRAPAAIAVVSALMPAKSLCAAPSRAVPVLIAHGTGDKIAPYAGGIVSHWSLKGRGSGISAEESVRVWRQLAGLPDTPVVSRFAHRQPSDPTAATRYVWGADPGKLQVVFLKIEQGGHNPPSIARRLSWLAVALVGEQNADLEFAEECWTFFKDKRSPAVAE
ncbi:MAG: PHB depolymerase family esterase [Massilia sp.]